MKRILTAILMFVILTASLSAAGRKELTLESSTFFALGTTCSVSIYGGDGELFTNTEELILDIENRMSVKIKTSEISAVNNAAGIEAVTVSEDVFRVIEAGLRFSNLSGGAFDISVGPLVSLWDIGGSGTSVPPEDKIASALDLVDYRLVEITSEGAGGTLYLPKPGMALEPGGIAKGFAADAAAAYLAGEGVESALINFGGNVLTIGSKPDGSSWRIGIQNPDSSRGDYIGIATINNKAVVTSGKYERFFIGTDGKRYHHILSTADGYPVENGIAQVSIIAADSMTADAMSTTIFSLGLEKGMALAESMGDVEAVVVLENGEVYITDGLGDYFKLTDTNFTLVEQE